MDVISESDPDDSWYFDFIKAGKKVVLNFDYNQELNQTLFFFNVLMGTPSNPLGTAGVGMNPESMVKEFKSRKLTENSRLWLIDGQGKIQIAASTDEIGKSISNYIPQDISQKIIQDKGRKVYSDVSQADKTVEIAKMNIGNTDYMIVVEAPTNELIKILNPIRTNAIVFGLLFFAITLFLVYLLTNSITNPLQRITRVANEFSTGNLTSDVDDDLLHRNDEIGNLSITFKEVRNQISKIIQQVKQSAETVSKGSLVLTSSSEELSSRATQQASATEEVSASMEEMGANISQNATNAKQTESIMDKASKDTQEGGEIVKQTVDAIKNINEDVKIIEEIAMQTNILALNAAVEAARAGEH